MKIRLLFALALIAIVSASKIEARQGLSDVPKKTPPKFAAKRQAPPRAFVRRPNTQGSAASPRLVSHITAQPRIGADYSNVSVLQDDGTLIIPQNNFDLANDSIVFTPQSGGGYTVQAVTPAYVGPPSTATGVRLCSSSGCTSDALSLGFNFPFYGSSYSSVYINPNGNLTFGAADTTNYPAFAYFGLKAIETGPPRIAALFDDMVDTFGGGEGEVGYLKSSTSVTFYWYGMEDVDGNINTFEITLQNNGVIQINYSTVGATQATVAITQGNATSVQTTDFASQTSPLAFSGTIGEVFSAYLDLDLSAVGQAFYQYHPDNYDGFIAFADMDGMDGSYAQPVRNGTQNINVFYGLYNFGTLFGSASRLFITGNAGSVNQYPSDPTQILSGSTYSTLTTMGNIIGHAWMAYVDASTAVLVNDNDLDWAFTMNANGSVMGGNTVTAVPGSSNTQFITSSPTYQYSPLDEYLMGLLAPGSVPSFIAVESPTLVSAPLNFTCNPFGTECDPEAGVTFNGTQVTVTMSEFEQLAGGARNPTTATSQKSFNVAYILVEPQGQSPNPSNLAQVQTIAQEWSPWFATATNNLGGMSTNLQALPPTISSITPNQGLTIGGSLIAINGTALQANSTVTIGGVAATVVSASSTGLQVIAPPSSTATTATVTVTSPGGQTASSTYTYTNAPTSQVQVTLAPDASLHTVSSGTASTVQAGYAVVNPGTGIAVIQSYANGVLASEAAVAPTPAATQWTMYAEYDGPGTGISTGVAIANPGTAPANLTLTLSGTPINQSTQTTAQTTYQVPAGGEVAEFVQQFFSSVASTSFLGTMSVQSDQPVSIVALRGTSNSNGQFIISTIPVSPGTPGTGGFGAFPVISDGGGYDTDIILVNSGTSTSSGTVSLFGFPAAVQTSLGTNTQFAFTIPAGGMWRLRTSGVPASVTNGYATMSVTTGSPTPSATAIIRLTAGANLVSETAVPAQTEFTNGMMFGSNETNLQTGVALLNGTGSPVLVTLTPLNSAGQPTGVSGTVTVPAYSNVTKFLNQIISALPIGYEGTVLIQSGAPIWAVSLRGTTTVNGFLMSTTPVLDPTDNNYSGTYYLPRIADGGGYTTEFLLMNAGSASPGSVQLQFFNTSGVALSLPLQ